jgi:crossover junction endonuclease MUS81
LPLGDMLWVAQIKPEYAQRLRAQNPGDEESFNTDIVLDHIMERKRLDDLIGSIKDGRFNEQKFRLRKSGIQNVTYLVEDYSISAERSDKYGEAVESVIASLQVVSDIFVKQTSKLDDTIRYLARVTKALKEMYRTKEVRVVRSKALERGSHLELMERLRKKSPSATIGTTFSAFASLCHKSESMTLGDVYLKMLLCMRGLTPDKAVEIQKLWPTPQALITAFEGQADAKGREIMIASRLSDAIPRKKVGKALSAKIAHVWS